MIWDEEDRFNTLRSIHVWDSSEGNASCTANKTSVYLFNEDNECLARMVNISTSVIDEIDDFSLSIDVLLRMIKKYMDLWKHLYIKLNSTAHEQLMVGIYKREGVALPKEGDFEWKLSAIAGARVIIEPTIKNNQETVI